MEQIETKEVKLKRIFLEYFKKIKEGLSRYAEIRVHDGNQVSELITEFKKSEDEVINSLIQQFLEKEFKESLTETDLAQFRDFVKAEIEKYFAQVEQDAYKLLHKYIITRFCETSYKDGKPKKRRIPDHITGSYIYLLTTNRPLFEQYLKSGFLSREGPGRANFYGLTAENLPDIDKVVREEVDKLLEMEKAE